MKIIKQSDNYEGEFYLIKTEEKKSEFDLSVEQISDFEAFCCSYMKEPFFMAAKSGSKISDIPKETQWLAIKHTDNSYTVYFSLASDTFRTTFYSADDMINISALTADDSLCGNSFYAFYKISGNNFYELIENAAKSIAKKYPSIGLRSEKKNPDFIDYFGWCTWDSFYDTVSANDIKTGLESFEKGGFVPKLVILDDGWQTVTEYSSKGQWKLSSFKANEKFNHNLSETVSLAKDDFGVKMFFVWHAVLGYWGGVDTSSAEMQKYNPTLSEAVHTHGIKEINPTRWESEKFPFGMIDANKAFDFYNDYHTYLKNEGIDGVKIDVQGSIPGHSNGRGGRCALVRTIREALESSVCKNFDSNIINCMSNNNDTVYNLKNTNMIRTSDDFFPEVPESHSNHVYTNAINSIWMSEFSTCDWDMFQTNHKYAQYHAASRAISGGPVYVSDKVDEHDFDLIKKLVSTDGKIFRAENIARPTVDSIFINPAEEKTLFKIFNKNKYNGVVGIFSSDIDHMQAVSVSPTDVDGFKSGDYISYSFKNKEAKVICKGQKLNVSLNKTEFDIITFCKITDGFAVIGLTDKLNSGATVSEISKTNKHYSINVADYGELLIYCEKNISHITSDDMPLSFTANDFFIKISVKETGKINIYLE